jgi:hypothetical protein
MGAAALAWQNQALCAETDPELFFGCTGFGGYAAARRICAACEVTAECLAFALATDETGYEHGVYGGRTPQERRELKRQQGITRPAAGPVFYLGAGTKDAAEAAGVSRRTIQRRRNAATAAAAS